MMKPFRSTLPLDAALAIVRDTVVPIARTERVAIDHAHGRVLATTIVAAADVPAFDRAAMDGYAIVATDTQGASRDRPVMLHLAGRVYAGDAAAIGIRSGTCLEIATGAPLPPGADAVVMVEDTALDATAPRGHAIAGEAATAGSSTSRDRSEPGPAASVRVFAEMRPWQHIVRRAADMRRGDVVIEAGTVLEPSRVGALAAIGIAEVEVFAKPIVAILPTGNEIVPPGHPLPPGHVYDVNRYTLGGLVERHGGVVRQLPTLVDTPEAVRAAIAAATGNDASATRGGAHHSTHERAGHGLTRADTGRADTARADATSADARPADLLIVCGGSSVGERDLVIEALREQGDVLFHGLAVKPGKPTAFARIGSTLVLGMPGNPTSCLSNAYVLMIPLLRAMARLPALQPTIVRATLAQRVTSVRGRLQFLPVRLAEGRAVPTFKGSGEITSLSRADGYVTIAMDDEIVDEGTPVDVTLY